jgi:hypothetical protein
MVIVVIVDVNQLCYLEGLTLYIKSLQLPRPEMVMQMMAIVPGTTWIVWTWGLPKCIIFLGFLVVLSKKSPEVIAHCFETMIFDTWHCLGKPVGQTSVRSVGSIESKTGVQSAFQGDS